MLCLQPSTLQYNTAVIYWCVIAIIYFFFLIFSSPLSAMVFGTNALFTKPAQSLAPMMVLNIFNQFGYNELKDAGSSSSPRYRHYHGFSWLKNLYKTDCWIVLLSFL